ncbi:MAG: hypothetical protein HOE97_12515 [Rhodospirillaceae bacterium]|nr:hypothetical protein [Rhodospirillaceae bacterium]
MTFTSSELHRGFTPLFSADLPDSVREKTLNRLHGHFDCLEKHLKQNAYLLGADFTVADAYCFTILNWENFVDVDLSPWPSIQAYVARVKARPKVQEAMAAEKQNFEERV